MIRDALNIFEAEYKKKGDSIITDSYIPADGDYVLIKEKDNTFEILEIINVKLDKKSGTIDRTNKYLSEVSKFDYLSKLIDMNKPIDKNKVVHSNNYLTFYVKKDSISTNKLTDDIIDNYYNTLKDPYKKYTKKQPRELYESVEKKVGKVNEDILEKLRIWIKENVRNIEEINYSTKEYLKIFLYVNEDVYKKENERYLTPNIYNSNDYNIKIGDSIYGVPNDNMGLNSKKPFLENKSKRITVPYLLNQREVLLQKKFFDYLMNLASARKVNVYFNEKGFIPLDSNEMLEESKEFSGGYLRIQKGKEVEILDFDVIPYYKTRLERPFIYNDILNSTKVEMLNENLGEIEGYEKLLNTINEVFYSKYLKNNFFTESKDIKINDDNLKRNLLLSRNGIFNWFYKGKSQNIFTMINKVSLSLIKGSINNGYIPKAQNQFNLRESLRYYFKGGEDMADIIKDVKDELYQKLSSKETEAIQSDREYYFAVGQMVSYMLSKSKGKKNTHSLANPYVNAKTDKRIKELLRQTYKKYNYDIEKNRVKFNNLYGMILTYEPGKVDEDMIIAGYLHNNLIYMKSNKEDIEDEK